MVTVDILVEGWLDETVARKIISFAGHQPGTVYGKHGLGYLKTKLSGFNELATHGNPILALVDFMDTKLECPPQLVQFWLPQCPHGSFSGRSCKKSKAGYWRIEKVLVGF